MAVGSKKFAGGTERIGAHRNPPRGRFVVPSERTFRCVLAGPDADALDLATCRYAADVVVVRPQRR
jgi:hypothetical protein